MNVSCPECRSVFRVDPSKLPASVVRARCAVCGGLITITPSSSVRDEFAPRASSDRPAVGQVPAAAATGAYSRGPQAAPAASPFAAPVPAAAPPAPPPSPPPAASPPAFATNAPAGAAPFAAATSAAPSPPPPAHLSGAAALPHRPEPPPARPAPPEAAPPNLGAATAAALFGRVDVSPSPAGPGRPPGVPPRAPSPARPAIPFVRPGGGTTPPRGGPTTPTPFGARTTPPGGQGAPRRPINPFLANDPNAKARRLARALISDMVTYFPEKREEGLRTGALKQLFEEEITKSYGEYVEQVGREFAESTPFFQEALNEILAGGRKLF